MRNPWGKETYIGPHSDKISDGEWWTDAKTYHQSFAYTNGNPDVYDEHMTYFAKFNVFTPMKKIEKMSIVSNQDQTVYISAYTYNSQHIRNGECGLSKEFSIMKFWNDKTKEWIYPMYDNNHVEPIEMKAGEVIAGILEYYWAPGSLVAHDFSIVVQAEKSPVTIRWNASSHSESEHFPTYKLSANVETIEGSQDKGEGDDTDGESTDGDDTNDRNNTAHWPSKIITADPIFNHDFQFAEGENYVWSHAEFFDGDKVSHEIKMQVDGVESIFKFDIEAGLRQFNAKLTESSSGASERWSHDPSVIPLGGWRKISKRTDSEPE